VASDRVHERASFITPDEYVRAYTFVVGEREAKKIVADDFPRLRADPENQLVLGPEFIALLALLSESGRALARTKMSDAELLRLQRALCEEYATIREAFPHVLTRENGDSA
jgi:hypothetical protein